MPEEDSDTSDLLLDRLSSNALKFPNKPAASFVSPGPNGGKLDKQLTYQQIEQTTTHLASRLLEHGLAKGDLAVLVYPPSLDFLVAFLACLKAGVTAVPVFPPHPNRRDTLNMFTKIAQGCKAKYALTNTEYSYAKKLSSIREAVKLKRTAAAWPESLEWIVTNSEKFTKGMTTAKLPAPSRSDLAFLQYTSGSTSDAKGVMITFGNLAHNLSCITRELRADEETVVVSWLPQYHDMGLIGSYLGVLYCGGSGYYMSPLAFLQRPMLWIEAVSKYKASHLQAPNFAFKLTARKFQPFHYDESSLELSTVKHIINAAEPVDEASMEEFYKCFCAFKLPKVIYPTYGLAEHTVFVCSGGKQRLRLLKKDLEMDGRVVEAGDVSDSSAISTLVGCGYSGNQGIDVQIVNHETQTAVENGTVGEVWINSPSKAAGYYMKPTETKNDFHATMNGSDVEYLRTGDLGFLYNGELFICGRLKDLIIVGGRNYYPQDIEGTAEANSDLFRLGCSAAFSIDLSHEGGEEVALVMELKEVPSENVEVVCYGLAKKVQVSILQEHSLGISEIIFLKPRTVPKTSSGKIARAWCRKGFVGGTLVAVYRHSFRNDSGSLEVDASHEKDGPSRARLSRQEIQAIRDMSRGDILGRLISDLSSVASVPASSISKDTALIQMMDSLTISQFKGQLATHYDVSISDEYLFHESTTVAKLVDIVKLGFAPDDGTNDVERTAQATSKQGAGQSGGFAQTALGCPPGVVCVIL
jgi:acyl-CoA synthetase (AMP-forming)/AMP-acid ligase II